MNNVKWLEERKMGIGGTDISALMHVNLYKTPLDVFNEKISDDVEETEPTPPMIFGQKAEKLVIEYWEEQTGIQTFESPYFVDGTHSFLRGTPDRMYKTSNGELGILECKTSRDMVEEGDLKFMAFFCQLQWYMGLSGAKVGQIAILARNTCEFKTFEYEFEPNLYEQMVSKAIDFWGNHVVKKIPPEATNNEDLKALFPQHIKGCYLQASQIVQDDILKIRQIKEKIKSLQEQLNVLEFNIKDILRDNEGFEIDGQILVTWKKSADSLKFDTKTFSKEHPDIYKNYLKNVAGSRRFYIR